MSDRAEAARAAYVEAFPDCDGWDQYGPYYMHDGVRHDHDDRIGVGEIGSALLDYGKAQRQAGYEECRVRHGILSAEEGVRLLALIENPPAPTPAMIDALNDYLEEDDT